MSEIEKMKRYIERTKFTNGNSCQMRFNEVLALSAAARETPTDIIILAFEYGKAKGYRAAKAAEQEKAHKAAMVRPTVPAARSCEVRV